MPLSLCDPNEIMFVNAQGLLISPVCFPCCMCSCTGIWYRHPETQLCLGKCDSLPHHAVSESLLCSTPFFHFSLYFMCSLPLNLPLSPDSIILGIYIQSFKNNLRPSVLPCNMELGFFCPCKVSAKILSMSCLSSLMLHHLLSFSHSSFT